MKITLQNGPLDGEQVEVHESDLQDGNELVKCHGGYQRRHELVYTVRDGTAVFDAERTTARLNEP